MEPEFLLWVNKARPVIKNILTLSIPKEVSKEERDKYMESIDIITDDVNMRYWLIAFTHRSIDPNTSFNYEPYEILGDKMLGLVFVELVQEAYRDVNQEAEPGRITELLGDIMDASYQGKLSQKWGLYDLLETNAPDVKKTGSDIFESFFGMLTYINNLRTRGLGYLWSYLVLKMLLSDINLVTRIVFNPKVYINEVLTRYRATDVKPRSTQVNGVYEAKFIIPESLALKLGLTRKGDWTQKVQTGKTHDIAVDNAFRNLAEELRKLGIKTRERAEGFWQDKLIQPMYRKALNKGEYKDFKLSNFTKVNGKYVQLIGIMPDNYQVVITGRDFPSSEPDINMALELLTEYANA
jgi:hypothetical protein